MRRLGLRTRLVAGFVGVALVATLVAALLTSLGLHRSLDGYLERRAQDAGRAAAALAERTWEEAGGWTPGSLDRLAHELALTGYDFRLVDDGGTLLDTTKLGEMGTEPQEIARRPVRTPAGTEVATLELYALGGGGDLPADRNLRRELDRAHLLAAVIAALLAIAAGLVIAGRLAEPLRRLAAAARGLASGDVAPPAVAGSPEVRELGEALGVLADDLGRQSSARRQLAQDLSHELRTPLMLLQGRIEAMQDGVVPFDADGLATLHTETLRLSRLIGQIERLAETEAEPSPVSVDAIPLHEVAQETGAALAAAFEVRGARLELDAVPVTGWGDRDAVRQITTNLLTNALKYAPEGEPVRLSTATEGEWAVLRVRDRGDGLREGEETRVFDRFYRGPAAAGREAGAGLGLAIARELAQAQGGVLSVEPSEDGGTCFALRLPTRPPAEAGSRSARAGAPGGR